jgi:hypothetical protein|tara:strand:- start:379 stop:741 length:363 start_codon:yes stop_codon:yes gene_type:complete
MLFDQLKQEYPYLLDVGDLDHEGIAQKKYLFRGINRTEVTTLENLGPDRFTVYRGTEWEPFPGENVKFWAGPGHSSFLVVQVERDPLYFTNNNLEFLTQEQCIETFEASVKVFYYGNLPD